MMTVRGRGGEERYLVASTFLGAIHHDIREAQEAFRIPGILRVDDDTHARGEMDLSTQY